MSKIPALARTTPRFRAEIQSAKETQLDLAVRCNVTRSTAQKWQSRDQVQDLSHLPHRFSTTLTDGEETVIVALQQTLVLPLDDLLVVTCEFINKLTSRFALRPAAWCDAAAHVRRPSLIIQL